MKRIPLLLIIIAVMAFGAINASANCVACRHITQCVSIADDEAIYCTWIDGCCMENGFCTYGGPLQASLASQYTVASVERLDEQRVITAANTIKTTPSSSIISQNR